VPDAAALGKTDDVLTRQRRPPARAAPKDTAMQATAIQPATVRYAKCIEASKRVRWEIDRDVIRGRKFDLTRKYIPDALARMESFAFLTAEQKKFVSQVQGRTYANMFGLVERYIGAKVLDISRGHWLGDQTALEALVRFSDEELKHQELFRRLEGMMAEVMPAGYTFPAQPNDVAAAVLSKNTWAVLALTCHIELFTLVHYRQSIDPDAQLSELWKDVFLFHMKEESQHAVLDEMEWKREHDRATAEERDRGVDDLIALVGAVDGILQMQAQADTGYFVRCTPAFDKRHTEALRKGFLEAYRWQYIVSGVQNERFMQALAAMVTDEQMTRIGAALAPIMAEPATA